MLAIKDYLNLKKIKEYLHSRMDEEIKENHGFASQPVYDLEYMINSIDRIIEKLESEE